MGYLIFSWVIFVAGAYWLADEKGNSGGAIVVLGLFTGPFAFLMAWATPVNHIELQRQGIKNGRLKLCSYCDEPIRKTAIKCKHCCSDLSATASPPPAKTSQPVSDRDKEKLTFPVDRTSL